MLIGKNHEPSKNISKNGATLHHYDTEVILTKMNEGLKKNFF
jgi:hypothetical protein